MPAENGAHLLRCLRPGQQLPNPVSFFLQQCLDVRQHCLQFIARKLARAVLIHVDDFARSHVHPRYRNGDVDSVNRHIAVTWGNAAQQILKFHRPDLVNIARGSVGNRPQTTYRFHRRRHVASG